MGGRGAGTEGAGEGIEVSLAMREWPGVEIEDSGEGENCGGRFPKLVRVVSRSRSRKEPLKEFIADNGLAVLIWREDLAPRRLPSMTFVQLAPAFHTCRN